MRLYLSGPMSGIKDFNRPAFAAATAALRAQGHFVVDPTELDGTPTVGESVKDTDLMWRAFLTRDLALILTSDLDAIALLPGWPKSRGSRLELHAGLAVGLKAVNALKPEEEVYATLAILPADPYCHCNMCVDARSLHP